MRPFVAIVGRPNVGKSTLLNRLSGKTAAVVADIPGVTRDRIFVDCQIGDRDVLLVDTGGFDPDPDDDITRATVEQAQMAVEAADLVLLVCDAKDGLHPVDQTIATMLRKAGKPTLCLVNKADPGAVDREAWDFYRLGIDFVEMSASHGTGFDAMADQVISLLPPEVEKGPGGDTALRMCVLGRPNVGKSSLCNALAGEQRQMVSDIPGTTRDAVDMLIERDGLRCRLVDTPGVRRKRSVAGKLERMSVLAALRSMERSEVAVVVMDGSEPTSDQDARLLRLAHDRRRGLVVAVNKIDLWDAPERRRYLEDLDHRLRFVSYAPVVQVSALTRAGLVHILPAVKQAHDSMGVRISTGELNRFAKEAVERHEPPLVRGRRAKIYYITQAQIRPPTFVVWVNDPLRIPESYKRFLENQLRKRFPFPGAPLRWSFRGKKEA